MPAPCTVEQPCAVGPPAQPHQFCVALTAPPPRLETPAAPSPCKLFRWISIWPGVLTATSIALPLMPVPVRVAAGVPALTLTPVGPEVLVSPLSAPFRAM